jgi:uncharacterized protein
MSGGKNILNQNWRLFWWKLVFIIVLFGLFSTQTMAASFDCKKATTWLEKTICSNPELSKLDEQMAKAYHDALASLSPEGQKETRQYQRQWLNEISSYSKAKLKLGFDDSAGAAEHALKNVYEDRIKQLRQSLIRFPDRIENPRGENTQIKSYDQLVKEAQQYEHPCGDYSFTTQESSEHEKPNKAILSDKYGHSIEVNGNLLSFRGCIDIDGDKILEAAVSDYLRACGGAPCSKVIIYGSNKNELKEVGHIAGDFGEESAFADLNGDGKTEILSYSCWANWGDLDLQYSPFLPTIYCYKENKFVECTDNYPEIIVREIATTLKQYQDIVKERLDKWHESPSEEEVKEFALKYFALHDIIHKESIGWAGVKKHFPRSVYDWLRREWK